MYSCMHVHLTCSTMCHSFVQFEVDATAAGETGIQQAHEKRFQDRVQQLFNQFKKQRLTSAAYECEKLVSTAKDKLSEVCLLL